MSRFSASVGRSAAVVAIAGLSLGGCTLTDDFPPVDVDPPPPNVLERSMLGPDADVPFFLDKFRRCAKFASFTYCQTEMYGGGEID